VNGSNRILSHGAPQPRMMPNGCLGSPVLVLLLVLTEASSWMSVRSKFGKPLVCAGRFHRSTQKRNFEVGRYPKRRWLFGNASRLERGIVPLNDTALPPASRPNVSRLTWDGGSAAALWFGSSHYQDADSSCVLFSSPPRRRSSFRRGSCSPRLPRVLTAHSAFRPPTRRRDPRTAGPVVPTPASRCSAPQRSAGGRRPPARRRSPE